MQRTVFRSDDAAVNPYRLLTAVVVPRPIAWVSTLSATGVVNLAPHSFYTVACARPPIVQFTSVGAKDTLRNALATGEFVGALASAALLHQVNDSSAAFDADASEPHLLDIAMEPSESRRPPRVRDSPVSIECSLHSTHELGELHDRARRRGPGPSPTRCWSTVTRSTTGFPLARLGRDEWGRDAEGFSIRRPRTPDDIESQD